MAKREIAAIAGYIADRNVTAAIRFLERVDDRLRLLADNPRLGAPVSIGMPGLRSFTVSPYILYYRPISGGICLIRVLHGARNAAWLVAED